MGSLAPARTSRTSGNPRGTGTSPVLSDPEIAKGAREVRRIYGADVRVSFLDRKAGERGLAIPELTTADLPAEF